MEKRREKEITERRRAADGYPNRRGITIPVNAAKNCLTDADYQRLVEQMRSCRGCGQPIEWFDETGSNEQ